jgi:tetratricopeptide (TPR) repeat protein
MDVPKHNYFDEIIEKAIIAKEAKEYNKAISLLKPLLKHKNKKKLTLEQESCVTMCLSVCYSGLSDYKSALPHAERNDELTRQLDGPRTFGYVKNSPELYIVYRKLGETTKARNLMLESISIMEELNLLETEEYGITLLQLGVMDYDQGKCKEALVYFEKAKGVLAKFKHREDYVTLLSLLSQTYQQLNLWNEALKCRNESVELTFSLYGDNCPLYAVSIYHLAMFYFNLKQYEEAISRFEKAHIVLPMCMVLKIKIP